MDKNYKFCNFCFDLFCTKRTHTKVSIFITQLEPDKNYKICNFCFCYIKKFIGSIILLIMLHNFFALSFLCPIVLFAMSPKHKASKSPLGGKPDKKGIKIKDITVPVL